MIAVILIMQLASNQPMTIKADPRCENVPNLIYQVGDVVCLPSEVIFRSGFDGLD